MSPHFNETTDEALLQGLDCSEVSYSQIHAASSTSRIDAEFFSRRYLANQEMLRDSTLDKLPLGVIATKIDVGHVGSMTDSYRENGVPLLQTQSIEEFTIDFTNCVRITEEFHRFLKKSQVFPGDCLIARTGSIGNAAFVMEEDPQPLNSADIIIVRADPRKVTNGYLAGFLNSRAGALQIERFTSGGVQGHINLTAIEHLVVPLPSKKFQEEVHAQVVSGLKRLRESRAIQEASADVFSEIIGLKDWEPSTKLTCTRKFSEVSAKQRMDSEHYQEKFYAARRQWAAAGAENVVPLGRLVTVLTNGHTPLHHDLREGDVAFLCAEHVSNFEVRFDSDKRILQDHHSKELARTALKDGDILLTIKGRVGNMALVEDLPCQANINQDVALLRLNDRMPVWFVLAFVNSRFGRLQVEQLATGGINPFLGLSNVRKLEIPILKREIMNEIAHETRKHVHMARKGHSEARKLLSRAKQAVEVAIAQNEAAGAAILREVQ